MKISNVLMAIFVLFLTSNLSFCVTTEYFIKKTLEEVKPREVAIWSNFQSHKNKSVMSEYQQVHHIVKSIIPTFSVNINKAQKFFKRLSHDDEDICFYHYDRVLSASLHIIIIDADTDYIDSFKDLLHDIKRSLFYLSKTKCLILLYGKSSYSLKILMNDGYENGFWDFSLIRIAYKQPMILYRYTIKSKKHIGQSNFTGNFTMFPEKIEKINGFRLKVGVKKNWKKDYKDNYGLPASKNINIYLLRSYHYFAEYLNITTKFKPLAEREHIMAQISENELDLILNSQLSISIEDIRFIYILKYGKLEVSVPLVQKTKVKLSMNMFYSLLALSGIIILIAVSVLCFKFNRNDWTTLNIYQLMLGYSTGIYPNCLRSRIVYFLLVMFSIFGISEFISGLTEIKYESNEELLVESIDDILRKNISVFTPIANWLLMHLIKTTTGDAQKLLIFTKPSNLTDALLNNQIIMSTDILEDNINLLRLQNHLNHTKFQRIDMNLPSFMNVVFFDDNFPFMRKYSLIHNRISEFGLDKKWNSEYKVAKLNSKSANSDIDDEDDTLLIILIALLSLGILLSCFAFLIEILKNTYHEKLNLRLV